MAAWLRQGLALPNIELRAGLNDALATRRMRSHQSGAADHRMFLWAWLALAHKLSATSAAELPMSQMELAI
jgi:asparagine synthase (glutamine-hydrolysing)